MKKIKLKILTIVIMLILTCNALIVRADIKQNNYIDKESEENKIIEIRVAIYDNRVNVNNDKESGGGKFLVIPIRDYEWKVGNRLYYFTINALSTRDILNGDLNISAYDVLIYSWEQADSFLPFTSLSNLKRNKDRVKVIRKFIEDGGGYYGSCGGALIAGNMANKPNTIGERWMKRSCLGISCFNIEYHTNTPNAGNYMTNSGAKSFAGICTDCNILKNSAIFGDFIGDTRKIHWVGAPAFIPPEKPDRETIVLARFPEEEFSDNESLKINRWKYTGGLLGYIKEFFTPHDEDYWNDKLGRISDAWMFAKDWINTGEVIETNISNKPFMTAEIFPNSNQSRIVRCSGHPEFKTRWGGHIEIVEDHDENNLYEGFFKWVNFIPEEETIEDEKTHNYCIIRRAIAWASKKVPDNDLPSVYGPSQVIDIYPYQKNSRFKISGNAETSEGIVSLDLYYKFTNNNSSWNDWIFYEKDSNRSDGWSWIFNSPNGSGYYQFCSIRHVEFEGHIEIEKAPPGPDAWSYVSE